MHIRLAYQLYSARDEAKENLYETLVQLKSFGYDGVEFAGFHGHTAVEIKQMLDEIGLIAVSGHVSLKEIEENPFALIGDYTTLGCKYLALSHLDAEHRAGGYYFPQAIQKLNKFGMLCKQAGIQFLYHNHGYDFDEKLCGMPGLDFLFAAVPDDLMQTELDTGWILEVGIDPVSYIRKYENRCPVIHLKDYDGVRGQDFCYKAVGHGKQKLADLLSAGLISGAEWFVVEQDFSTENPPLTDARLSCEAVREVPLFSLMGSVVNFH